MRYLILVGTITVLLFCSLVGAGLSSYKPRHKHRCHCREIRKILNDDYPQFDGMPTMYERSHKLILIEELFCEP